MVAGSESRPAWPHHAAKRRKIGPVGPLGGRAPGGLLVPEGLLGGVKERVIRMEPVQGDAGRRHPGSHRLDFRCLGRQNLPFGVDPPRNVRPYPRYRA